MLDKSTTVHRNGLNFGQRTAIADKLREVCTKDGKYAVYAPGWNDSVVARWATEILGTGATVPNVAYLRKQLFGVLRLYAMTPVPAPADDLEARVARLEADLERLRSALGAW